MWTKIEKNLINIRKPGRYIDGEWNSIHKTGADNLVRVCLAFPEIYEIGMANLGLLILYQIINQRTDALAERVYNPGIDFAHYLRSENIRLFSLESRTPLNNFDIVGFTLQSELVVTNVLSMLSLGGIPLLASERQDKFPLVIAGGPVTINCEPVAEFFDAFVLGDGEEVIGEIIEVVKKHKSESTSRMDLLLAIARINGVYVPQFYQTREDKNGITVQPVVDDLATTITRRIAPLNRANYPLSPIVPYVQTTADRLTVEIARGCWRKCHFCQATSYYGPWRVRSEEDILFIISEGLKHSGFSEISLVSLSSSDYPGIESLLEKIQKIKPWPIKISLPSLRCDCFSVGLAGHLGDKPSGSLTFAPEAGTERLRQAIGKYLSDEQILETAILASRAGWRQLKLYFMVGLPTETAADIPAIVNLVKKIKKLTNLNLSVTISPFVPKPQTPFQWVAMENPETLKQKIDYLHKNISASVRAHSLESALLEGVIARGDRRLNPVIRRAWELGARFDHWDEYFDFRIWEKAFGELGIDWRDYLQPIPLEKNLAWDHLRFTDKEVLKKTLVSCWKENQLTARENISVKKSLAVFPIHKKIAVSDNPYLYYWRLRWSRQMPVRYLSHLEQIEAFRRMYRRANWPLAYSGGYAPQPIISFGPAISVGYLSEAEYTDVALTRKMDISVLRRMLLSEIPDGFQLISLKPLARRFASLEKSINVGEYWISVTGRPELAEKISEFLAQPEIIIEKEKNGKIEKINVRPLIIDMKLSEPDMLKLILRFSPHQNVKPEKILARMFAENEEDLKPQLLICRRNLFIEFAGKLFQP